jgi:hypothetical protein
MSDVLELLARANPIPEAKRPEMEARASALADSWRLRTAAATKAAPRSLWRLAVVAIVGLLVLVVAGTAVAVRAHWLDFSLAEPAPPKNVKPFSELDLGANHARRVPVVDNNGKTRTFWIAPTKRGGFCVVLDVLGGCEKLGTNPLIVEWAAMNAGGRRPPDPGVRTQIYGAANARWIDSVRIRFADGESVRPRVTWVSRPIGFGFFYYDVPAKHRVRGHGPTKVVALGSAQNVVTESYGAVAKQPVPPVDAIQAEKTVVARAQTPDGEVILWRAPTRYRSTCAWVQLGDRAHMVDDCLPGGYSGPSFTFMPTRRSVVVAGRVGRRFDRVELEFADLSHVSAELVNGFLLYSIPPDHLVAAKQLVAFRLVNDDGSTAIEDELTLGLSGCHAPLPTTENCR